jgi:lysozyme family protein
MTDRFLKYFPLLIDFEGSVFENDPDDAGGATKFGIDQRSHPGEDIQHLTLDRAREIYWNDYWLPVHGDEMPKGVGEVMFDIAVNNGRGRAIKWAQETSGATADGVLGPKTIAAINAFGTNMARTLIERREDFYRSIAKGSQAKYLRGWLNRNNRLWDYVAAL